MKFTIEQAIKARSCSGFTRSLTSVLGGVSGQRHAQAALPQERDPVPIVEGAGWAPGRSGGVRKMSPTHRFYPRTVQPVVSRYTDYAISAVIITIIIINDIPFEDSVLLG